MRQKAMRLKPKPFNPKLAKWRARGGSFWRKIREAWKKVPVEDRTPQRYAEVFSEQAGLAK